MRIRVFLLLLPAIALALSPKDEAAIRAAIQEQARIENQRPTGQPWSERGPGVYRIRSIEELTPDVAAVEADRVSIGTYGERRRYTLILKRSGSVWSIVKRIRMYSRPQPGIQPIEEFPGPSSR